MERSIAKSDVDETISNPTQAITVRYGRKAAFRRLRRGYLVVIYEEREEDFIVVTAVKVNKERVRRYGFTRIR
jgi:mRNA-degrading endonuclease RelE of RelBE toxin-antitoxin system